jgi:hypothetical protein
MYRPIKCEPVDGLSAEAVARGGNCLLRSLTAQLRDEDWYNVVIQKAVQCLGEVSSFVGFCHHSEYCADL